MAGEYDEKFEELTGLIKRTMGGVDEMRLEMRDLRLEVRDNTSRLTNVEGRLTGVEGRLTGVEGGVKSLEKKIDNLSSQFNAVGSMSIGDHKRIDHLEERVDVLEAEVH